MVQTINSIDDNTSKKLSIQVSLNGFSFCITNKNQKIIAIEQDNFGIQLTPKQVLDKIKYSFNHNKNLREQVFNSIDVIHQNDLYTVVPKPLFDEKLLNEYLKFNTKVLKNDFIAYDTLDRHDIVTVYIPYTNINNYFFDSFGSFTYKHTSTILINSLITQEKNNESTTVFANINDDSFDIIVFIKGKFVLSNTFKHQTKEDFLYYLMHIAEQLKLNPEEFNLFFLGNISEDSEFYKIAYTYINNVSFGSHQQQLKLASEITPFKSHQYFTLLSHF
ncbi:DUF3822 family protein [Aquimarina longa]|uniref:DUF3822 family protein n=1 Tax=Aquimarina longa TaxID=1080221 RepID=UPI00078371A8|nr:DUF3822 family protein [Aquimarina longa]